MMRHVLFLICLCFAIPTCGFAQKHVVKRSQKTVKTTPKPKNDSKTATHKKAGNDNASAMTVIRNIEKNMVRVEGGTFTMGTPEGWSVPYDNGKPRHEVTLSSYCIGRYEVTLRQWRAVMGANKVQQQEWFVNDSPVIYVTWYDCQKFINKLNSLTGRHYRLPTEAEWEYAARGGNRSRGNMFSGGGRDNITEWKNDEWVSYPMKVGQFAPNELGLYDMSGNAAEWCQDWYGDYPTAAQTNPVGPASGSKKVLRGGQHNSPYQDCIVTKRGKDNPDNFGYSVGFRLAMDAD